jgi:hypothetical protein
LYALFPIHFSAIGYYITPGQSVFARACTGFTFITTASIQIAASVSVQFYGTSCLAQRLLQQLR